MLRGLYTSALGMTVQMNRMDVVTNNIANSDTTGYKRDIPITQSFSDILERRLDDLASPGLMHDQPVGNVNLGVFVDTVHTDFAPGTLRMTGGALELAITGDGFFSVSVSARNGNKTEMYTRDGSFTLSSDRRLVTLEGNAVLGEGGEMALPDGEITITDDGYIFVNGELIDRLKLVDFENKESLRKTGDNLYNITDDTITAVFDGKVAQGCLENSNANTVREMVDMITINRAYEANQRVITTYDANLNRAVNDIARK